MKIKFLENHEIDAHKYQQCVENGVHTSIYGHFNFLQAITDNQWGVLVLGDYQAVFPLPWRRKYGLFYIYTPLFCQQLGIFGDPKNLTTQDFLVAIPRKFIRVNLNVHSKFGRPAFSRENPNFILEAPLDPEVSFNKDAWKNIQKCQNSGVSYQTNIDFLPIIDLYHQTWGSQIGFDLNTSYSAFKNACDTLEKSGNLFTINATLDSQILGGAIFLMTEKSVHYVCAAPTELGKKFGVMHGIIHEITKLFPTKNLDFEGSSIPSVAQFYKKFGPVNHPYYSIRRTLWFKL